MKGKLITFEGVEGSGKSTQTQIAFNWLNSVFERVIMTREPGGTVLGNALRELLLESRSDLSLGMCSELLLYAADRAQHVQEVILSHLEDGCIVLCDRYTDSTVAYQGYGRGIDLSVIDQINQIASQGVKPDLTIWLDLDPGVGLIRSRIVGEPDRMEKSDIEFHNRVRKGFEELAIANPDRIVRIVGSDTEAAVAGNIQTIIEDRINYRWIN